MEKMDLSKVVLQGPFKELKGENFILFSHGFMDETAPFEGG